MYETIIKKVCRKTNPPFKVEKRIYTRTNYVYKLEHLETNITINTLEKVMNALECDISSFFDITKKDENPEIVELITNIKNLPDNKQKEILSAFHIILNNLK